VKWERDLVEEARSTREVAERSATRRHPGAEPSDPPPRDEVDDEISSLIKKLAKKIGPWVALGTAITTAGGWIFGFGRKTADIATKADVAAASSADIAVQQAQASQLEAIRNRLSTIEEHQRDQDKSLDEIKAVQKELLLRPGLMITNQEKPKHGTP